MNLTPQARKIWDQIPKGDLMKILNNVWCGQCSNGKSRSIAVESGVKKKYGLVLKGRCTTCNGPVARVIETDY